MRACRIRVAFSSSLRRVAVELRPGAVRRPRGSGRGCSGLVPEGSGVARRVLRSLTRVTREQRRLAARGTTQEHVRQGFRDGQAVVALEPKELAGRVELEEDV